MQLSSFSSLPTAAAAHRLAVVKALLALLTTTTLLWSSPLVAAQEFSYDPRDPFGPRNWGQVDVPDNQCDGRNNSPINFESQDRCDVRGDFVYRNGNCRINNNFYSVTNRAGFYAYPSEGCTPPSMRMPWKDGIFDAQYFEFHLTSEHTLNDNEFDAELQIVHLERGVPDSWAITAIWLTANDNAAPNRAFEKIISGWDLAAAQDGIRCSTGDLSETCRVADGVTNYQGQRYDIYDLIPTKNNGNVTDYFGYEGGFTIPPCREVVAWNVAISRLIITGDQLSRLTSLIAGYRDRETCDLATIANPRPTWSTNRPTQPVNGRTVAKVCRELPPRPTAPPTTPAPNEPPTPAPNRPPTPAPRPPTPAPRPPTPAPRPPTTPAPNQPPTPAPRPPTRRPTRPTRRPTRPMTARPTPRGTMSKKASKKASMMMMMGSMMGGSGDPEPLVPELVTVYFEFFQGINEELFTGVRPIYNAYDGSGPGGLSEPVGQIYLLVVITNFPQDNPADNINISQVTFRWFDGSMVVISFILNLAFEQPFFFPIVGGSNRFNGVTGHSVNAVNINGVSTFNLELYRIPGGPGTL